VCLSIKVERDIAVEEGYGEVIPFGMDAGRRNECRLGCVGDDVSEDVRVGDWVRGGPGSGLHACVLRAISEDGYLCSNAGKITEGERAEISETYVALCDVRRGTSKSLRPSFGGAGRGDPFPKDGPTCVYPMAWSQRFVPMVVVRASGGLRIVSTREVPLRRAETGDDADPLFRS
jgi:hypothetical protein